MRKIRQKWLKKFPVAEDAIELEKLKSFLSKELIEKGGFLWKPLGITPLPNGNIIVNDQKAHHILMFDDYGYLIRKIGKNGQGPGEFVNPYSMTATPNAIIISDNGNMRIQFFDFEGNYIRSFKIFKALWDIETTHNGLIYGVPMRVRPEEELINVMNNDGVILNTFGEARFDIGKSNWLIPNMVRNISINNKNELFLAFDYFPLICKYSEKGELIAEYKLNHDLMKEKEKINLNHFKNNQNRNGLMPVIRSIRADINSFYVLYSYPRAGILEYNMEGKIQKEYYYEYTKEEDPHFIDFIVKDKEGEKSFYLLKESQENEIVILRPRKSLSKGRR